MAKLAWDTDGSRRYQLGVTKCVLYPKANNAYEAGVAWNGITSIQESPDGADANDMYADDVKYASLRSVETFGGTIEAYTYPDAFMQCDGTATYSTIPGVHLGQQKRKPFGLSYITTVGDDVGNEFKKMHLIYNCTASPSDRQYETINDSPDAITFSWEFESTGVKATDGKIGDVVVEPISSVTIDYRMLNADQITALENKIYGVDAVAGSGGAQGTAGSDPTLPTPNEIYALLAAKATTSTTDDNTQGGE